jgi:hypothetical protein
MLETAEIPGMPASVIALVSNEEERHALSDTPLE